MLEIPKRVSLMSLSLLLQLCLTCFVRLIFMIYEMRGKRPNTHCFVEYYFQDLSKNNHTHLYIYIYIYILRTIFKIGSLLPLNCYMSTLRQELWITTMQRGSGETCCRQLLSWSPHAVIKFSDSETRSPLFENCLYLCKIFFTFVFFV